MDSLGDELSQQGDILLSVASEAAPPADAQLLRSSAPARVLTVTLNPSTAAIAIILVLHNDLKTDLVCLKPFITVTVIEVLIW